MTKKRKCKNRVQIVPSGVSGLKQDSSNDFQVDYTHVARAIANSDLNSLEENGKITGLHFPHYTITVEKLDGSKHRGWDTFGWTIWVKPKHREAAKDPLS